MSKCNRYDAGCRCSDCEADRLLWDTLRRQADDERNEILCRVRNPRGMQSMLIGDHHDAQVMALLAKRSPPPPQLLPRWLQCGVVDKAGNRKVLDFAAAMALLTEIDAAAARAFVTQPFNRHTLVTALHRSLSHSSAYRHMADEIAVVLRSAIDGEQRRGGFLTLEGGPAPAALPMFVHGVDTATASAERVSGDLTPSGVAPVEGHAGGTAESSGVETCVRDTTPIPWENKTRGPCMQFTFESSVAMELARKLKKFLASKGIVLPHSQALDAVAAMQGYKDWNALTASFKCEAIDALLHRFELVHLEANLGNAQQDEGELQAHTGFALRFPLERAGCSYVRVVDPLGREIAYWTHEEWAEDPIGVIGAIIGSLVRRDALT